MSQFNLFQHDGMTFVPRDVPGDGNCLFHCVAMSPIVPNNNVQSLRKAIYDFALGLGRAVAEKVFNLLHNPALKGAVSFIDAVNYT